MRWRGELARAVATEWRGAVSGVKMAGAATDCSFARVLLGVPAGFKVSVIVQDVLV